MYKVIVAGSRDFNNYKLLEEKLDLYLSNKDNSEINIVCGMAKGADMLGYKYAEANNIEVLEFPADWQTHGKSAGYIRNVEMAENATHLVAFWDGESFGTKHMIEIAREKGLNIRIVLY